jgi:GntR family transcriptional regulator
MFNLDYQSRLPIYEQIVEQFERYIAYGVLKPKEQVPSIRELAASLGINPNTVKKAYEELEKRGAIVTVSTKGTFVTDNIKDVVKVKIQDKLNVIKENIKELEKLGMTKEEIMKEI